MTKPVIKVSLLNVSLKEAKGLTDDEVIIEMRVGVQKSLFSGKGKTFKSTEVALF